jgi:serine/threonine protein kinase
MSASALTPGFRLGKYQVLAHVATGGMGAVYKALDTDLRRTVALKVLPANMAKSSPDLERFRREARLAARLSHKHIVTLYGYDYDAEHDLHYLAMEFIEGIDLARHIDLKGRLAPEDTRRILIQAAKALAHAYSRGVVHRDIKPSNFLLARVGNKVAVKLTDLGLALVQGEDDHSVTRAGTTVGTVDYMAPEQARDSRASDIRSDLYALGCTAFHMLAGKPPFYEGGLGERVLKHLQEPPPDVRQFNPAVSADFWDVLQKMLAKDPDDRYATPAQLLVDLNRVSATVTDEERAASYLADTSRRETEFVPNPTPQSVPNSPEQLPGAASDPQEAPKSAPVPTAHQSSGEISNPSVVTPDQARTAAAFHEKAVQVLNDGGDIEYLRELLGNCLKLDPFNPTYRKTLRDANRKAAGGVLGRLFGSLNVLAIKSKMRMARSSGDYRKVLEYGEEILARQPGDVDTHLEIAGAAEELGQYDLAIWFLDQARKDAPNNVPLLRELAHQHEQVKNLKRAIALLEKVQKLDPHDHSVMKKINELSVADVMSQRRPGQ